MIKRIDNICAIHYAPITGISAIDPPVGGPLTITTDWIELPIAPGAAISISESGQSPGRQYQTTFSHTLVAPLHLTIPVVLLITLTDGDTIIIGDLDIPVRLYITTTLPGTDISFTHTSWHFPYPLATS